MNVCRLEGCQKRAVARAMCHGHYYSEHYRKLHPRFGADSAARYRKRHPEKAKMSATDFRKRHYEKLSKDRIARRAFEISFFGGVCARCGFDDARALQVDHINGGGTRLRKTEQGRMMLSRRIKLDPEAVRRELQLLCANCNWIKRAENDETPKKRIANGV